jgi:uncharacterized glyoxalase superfamily protein PhnB
MTDAAANQVGTSVVPVIRYRNLPAAIDWLCGAFGFDRQRITADSAGTIIFGQLAFGTAMIMVGPVRQSAFDRFLKQPDEIGGAETQVCYFFVPDVHAHCARAKAAGAEILFDIEDQRHGGRSYSCRDPEGHLWNFGTYDPWRRQRLGESKPGSGAKSQRRGVKRLVLASALLLPVAVIAGLGSPGDFVRRVLGELRILDTAGSLSTPDSETAIGRPDGDRDGNEAAQRAAEHAAHGRLAQALSAKQAAEDEANELRKQLAKAVAQREAAELAAKADRDELLRTWIGKVTAERVARETRRQLARERGARSENANPVQGQTGLLPNW